MALSLSTQFPLLFPGSLAPDGHKAALYLSVFELPLQLIWPSAAASITGKDREKSWETVKEGLGWHEGWWLDHLASSEQRSIVCQWAAVEQLASFFLSFLIREDSGVKSPKHHKGICQGYIYQQYTSTQDSQKQLTRQDYNIHIRKAALVLS